MITQDLLQYIKSETSLGIPADTIKTALHTNGWAETDIAEAFSTLGFGVPSTTPVPGVPIKYAGFWIRWAALFIDGLVLIIPNTIVGFIIGIVMGMSGSTPASIDIKIVGYITNMLVTWLYFSLMTYKKGATLGKKLVGISVKSENMEPLSLSSVLLRETIGKFISGIILCLGYVIAAFTEKKQALHDKLAHSVVVYTDPTKSHRGGVIIAIIFAGILPTLAIVGILASVVLASLNVARQKGQDALAVSELRQMSTEARLYYNDNSNSYSNAKDCNSGMFLEQKMQQFISGIPSKNVTCYAEGASYAISATLNDASKSYCIDNSGYDANGTAVDTNSIASCQDSQKMPPAGTPGTPEENIPAQTGTNTVPSQPAVAIPPTVTADTPTENSAISSIKGLYISMRQELDTAVTMADIEAVVLKYGDKAQVAKLTPENVKKVDALPASFKNMLIDAAKNPPSNQITNIQITVGGTVATLHAQSTKAGFANGTVTYFLEDGKWKLDSDIWTQK